MRRTGILPQFALCALIAVAGCTTGPKSTTAPLPSEAAAAAAPAPEASAPAARPPAAAAAPRAAPASTARTIAAYKKQAAELIAAASRDLVAESLPQTPRSVALNITVDRDGNAVKVAVVRPNGQKEQKERKELERAALESVKRAEPLPAPSATLLAGRATVSYVETWLFRPDGRFQIRTLADEQKRKQRAASQPAGAKPAAVPPQHSAARGETAGR